MEGSELEKMEGSDLNIEESCSPKASIKRIDKGTVHNICSGQVGDAMKTLQENHQSDYAKQLSANVPSDTGCPELYRTKKS